MCWSNIVYVFLPPASLPSGLMQQPTSSWGYKITTDTSIDVYHRLLPRIDLKTICETITDVKEICKKDDGSIAIITDSPSHIYRAIEEVGKLFAEVENQYIDTPNCYYHVSLRVKTLMKEWLLAFEGALGILLTNDEKVVKNFTGAWQYINSPVGGLFLEPFTIFLYQSYAKVIHPVTIQNYAVRHMIEQKIAQRVNGIARRMDQSQKGFEGLAMLSYVEEKTNLSTKEIVRLINEKSYRIKAPTRSPIIQ